MAFCLGSQAKYAPSGFGSSTFHSFSNMVATVVFDFRSLVGLKYFFRMFNCTMGWMDALRTVLNVSSSAILAIHDILAAARFMYKCTADMLSNRPMMHSKTSCFLFFLGSLRMNLCPVRMSSGGSTTSTPPGYSVCFRVMQAGSAIPFNTTSTSACAMTDQALDIILFQDWIVTWRASLQSSSSRAKNYCSTLLRLTW